MGTQGQLQPTRQEQLEEQKHWRRAASGCGCAYLRRQHLRSHQTDRSVSDGPWVLKGSCSPRARSSWRSRSRGEARRAAVAVPTRGVSSCGHAKLTAVCLMGRGHPRAAAAHAPGAAGGAGALERRGERLWLCLPAASAPAVTPNGPQRV